MKREVWEELVDRVVDDECADEERRALYEAAERNPEIREALDAARRIRELMRRSAGATVPPEFSERLRLAIERSDVWVEREAARPTAGTRRERRGRRSGKRLVWAATGAAISFAAVAFFALDGDLPNDVYIARTVKPNQNDGLDKIGKAGDLNAASETNAAPDSSVKPALGAERPGAIIPPRSAGQTPETPIAAIPSGFYTRRVLDADVARRVAESFARFCNKINVDCEKIDGDFEFLIEKTTPATRNEILAWLKENAPEIGPRAKNNFEETWTEDGKKEISVRVSFFVAGLGDEAKTK